MDDNKLKKFEELTRKQLALTKELAHQNDEMEKRAAELVIANKELAFQNEEKEKRAAELIIANKELEFQNKEKEKRAKELEIANKELAFQNEEKDKRAAELVLANKELAFQNEEKDKRAAELVIADKELIFQTGEKADRAAELVIADKELAFQTGEKADRAAELIIANKELVFQNKEKDKRAAELIIANKELVHQNEEKEKREVELLILKDSLFNEKQLMEKTLISIGDGVISTDKNKKVLFLNNTAQLVTGWPQEEAFGKPVYEVFNIFNELTKKRDEDIVKKVMATGKIQLLTHPTILRSKDGIETLIEDSAAPILDEKNKVVGTVIIFSDYTEKWNRLKKIEYLSYHDGLTGLYNRRFYEEELHRMDNQRNLPLSLIMGDVNGLKLINDSFGHEVGDELLKKVASAINEVCRANDVSARLGGDEFIVILPNLNKADAVKVVERIQSCLKIERVQDLEISISLGSETKTDMSQDINIIYKNTEDHMYRNKVYEGSSMRRKTIDLITNTLFAKNGRELIHSKNVSVLVEALAEKMGFSEEDVNLMRLAGLMHDIGKIGIPDSILNKDGKLTIDEYEEIKKHPEIGYRILSSVNEFSEMSECVLEHH
ncbi:MAG TPA: diguanylate cyclase, partial [Atribacterota bacterium]|nr:diguanylate cyclase [Atribacterota bacterium]